jgi:hypothetical protein
MLGDVYSMAFTDTADELMIGCINGVFYLKITDDGFKPNGLEQALVGMVTLFV